MDCVLHVEKRKPSDQSNAGDSIKNIKEIIMNILCYVASDVNFTKELSIGNYERFTSDVRVIVNLEKEDITFIFTHPELNNRSFDFIPEVSVSDIIHMIEGWQQLRSILTEYWCTNSFSEITLKPVPYQKFLTNKFVGTDNHGFFIKPGSIKSRINELEGSSHNVTASNVGITRKTLWKWDTGEVSVALDKIRLLAESLSCPVETFLK